MLEKFSNLPTSSHSCTPVTPSKLPNWIHISFRRSEIRSDQRISEEPKNLVGRLPRLSHDDFAPMFTDLPMSRSQHVPAPRGRAGQPGPRAENREWGQMDARWQLATRDKVCDARRTPQQRANSAQCAMPTELPNGEQAQLACAVPEELPKR